MEVLADALELGPIGPAEGDVGADFVAEPEVEVDQPHHSATFVTFRTG